MKDLKERIANISQYLQLLMDPSIFPEVQKAAEKRDTNLLMEACRKSRIPEIYRANVVSIILSVTPQQKWPVPF